VVQVQVFEAARSRVLEPDLGWRADESPPLGESKGLPPFVTSTRSGSSRDSVSAAILRISIAREMALKTKKGRRVEGYSHEAWVWPKGDFCATELRYPGTFRWVGVVRVISCGRVTWFGRLGL
jgi:hypothetical protein